MVGDWESPSNFAPLFNDELPAAEVDSLLYAGLTRLDPNFNWLPDLAARVPTLDNGDVSWNRSAGTMAVTYRLRPGLRWSDGAPITAADVAYTWRVIVDPRVTGVLSTEGYDAIARIEIRDDRTFIVHFDRVYPKYLGLFPALLPEHRLRDISPDRLADDPFWVHPDVVSGPYTISELVPDEHITLVRNAAWSQGRKGLRPHLDSIIYKVYPEAGQVIEAARAGQVDLALEIPDDAAPGMTNPGTMMVEHRSSLAYEQVTFNQADPNPLTGRPPLWKSDPALLEALGAAVDRPGLIRSLLGGEAQLANAPIPSALTAFPDPAPPPAYSLDRANHLLDQDGWVRGPDGIRTRNGQRLAFTISTTLGNTLRLAAQDQLISDWQRVGASVTTRDAQPADLFSGYAEGGLLEHGQFEAGLWTWSIGPDPDGLYPIAHSTQIPTDQNQGRGSNFGRFASPAIDQALDRGRSSLDQATRVRAYQDFERAYAALGGELPLYERMLTVLASPRLHNLVLNPAPDTTLWNAADWWVPG